jgi:hypothetical protein
MRAIRVTAVTRPTPGTERSRFSASARAWAIGQQRGDGAVGFGHGLIELGDVGAQPGLEHLVALLDEADFLLLAHGDELVAPALPFGQALTRRIARLDGRQVEAAVHFGEHAGIHRVGLGAPADGPGKVTGLLGVDPGIGQTRLLQLLPQQGVTAAGGLQDDEAGPGQAGDHRRDRIQGIRDALVAEAFGKNVESGFGNVDSDENRSYHDGAWPCDARSVCCSLVQLFMVDCNWRRGPSPSSIFWIPNPPVSRRHHSARIEHTGTQTSLFDVQHRKVWIPSPRCAPQAMTPQELDRKKLQKSPTVRRPHRHRQA